MNKEIIHIVHQSFGFQTSEADLMQSLSDAINYLIVNDFNKLISILYRADISEKKLNSILQENKNESAGKLIAVLFVERHLQKIKSRQENRRDDNDIAEEDRW